MNPSPNHHSPPRDLLDPVAVGTLFGVLSALGYTAANICLRAVAIEQDPFWVSCIKPLPTIALAVPMIAWQMARGSGCWMSRRALLGLTAAGLFGQLAGNVAFQWSLGVIGMALAVPVTLGTLMIGGAVLGRFCLGESVTTRSALAMLILTISIVVLSSGSVAAHESVRANGGENVPAGLLVLAVGAAALAGFAYAVLGVVIRRAVTGSASLAGTLLVVSVCGLVTLFPISWARIGIDGILATGSGALSIMLLAGVFNAIAFFALSKGLRLLSVVHFNLLNASQTALAAVAGLLFFQEALTAALVAGVALTVGGLLLIEERKRPAPDGEPPAAAEGDTQQQAFTETTSAAGLSDTVTSDTIACQPAAPRD